MKHPARRALQLLTLALALILPATAGCAPFEATVEAREVRQGGFFRVVADGTETPPELTFMGRSWSMFRQADGSWSALLPIENLTPAGSREVGLLAGGERQLFTLMVLENDRKVQHIRLSPSKSGLKATDTEKRLVGEALRTESPLRLHGGSFERPCPGETSSLFGLKRSYNGGPVSSYHKGLDIAAPSGTPVRAPESGVVLLAGTVEEGFVVHGNTVVVDHGQGLTSIYLHLDSISVSAGERVDKGAELGRVGHTGISTAPHLHWGTYLYGTSVDPEAIMAAEL